MKNIDQIIVTLTLDEKVSLLSGFNSWYTNKIDKKRIIFADKLPMEEHLARHILADIFLDTFNFNANSLGFPVDSDKIL